MFLKSLFTFYVNSNLHVSVAVACLMLVVGKYVNVQVPYQAFFLGAATYIAYHFVRFGNRKKYEIQHRLEQWSLQQIRLLNVLLLIAFGLVIFALIKIEFKALLVLIPFGLLTLGYGLPIIPWKGEWYSLRFVPGIKIFVIALVWAGVCVWFGLYESSLQVNLKLQLFLLLICFVIAITIPFDIRDVQFDDQELKSLPQLLGIKGAKWFGTGLMALFNGIALWNFSDLFWQTGLVSLLVLMALWGSTTKRSLGYTTFWVEGIPVAWWLLLI